MRNYTRRTFVTFIAIAFVSGFVPASCYTHPVDDIGAVAPMHEQEQCVAHKLNSKPAHTETVSRFNVPLPKPWKFLPAAVAIAHPQFRSFEIQRKLPAATLQRMRVPIKPTSMPFSSDEFLSYFAAMRDA